MFHRFNLYHHEMLHFVQTIHNYIMVEVLESSWKVFQDRLHSDVQDLDGLIEVQRRFVDSILDKALLNEKNNALSRQLLKVLNQVYLFTYKKVQMFFPGAVSEFEFQRMSHGASLNQSLFSASESGIGSIGGHSVSKHVVDQMFANYNDFLSLLMQFKVMLQDQKSGQVDLKYMLFRLDFNEYYHEMALKEEEKKKHGARYDSNDDDDYMEDLGNDDYDQEDEDDDEEEDDNEEDDDDDEEDDRGKF